MVPGVAEDLRQEPFDIPPKPPAVIDRVLELARQVRIGEIAQVCGPGGLGIRDEFRAVRPGSRSGTRPVAGASGQADAASAAGPRPDAPCGQPPSGTPACSVYPRGPTRASQATWRCNRVRSHTSGETDPRASSWQLLTARRKRLHHIPAVAVNVLEDHDRTERLMARFFDEVHAGDFISL